MKNRDKHVYLDHNQPLQVQSSRREGRIQKKTSKPQGKRTACSKCGAYILKRITRIHKKYYCGKMFEEKEWKLVSSSALCLRCNKFQNPESIEFHVKYVCGKKPITIQCFYCPRLIENYKQFIRHMNTTHQKRHCLLDLLSVLPAADSITSENKAPKIVKNFLSNMLSTEQEAIVSEDGVSTPQVQVRNKESYKCDICGKILIGTHKYANHVNTKCESDNLFPCFDCDFKSVLAYEVLDHMENCHEKLFNTFDIIQAQLTGIIPLTNQDSSDLHNQPHPEIEEIKVKSKLGTNVSEKDTGSLENVSLACSDANNEKLENSGVPQNEPVKFKSIKTKHYSNKVKDVFTESNVTGEQGESGVQSSTHDMQKSKLIVANNISHENQAVHKSKNLHNYEKSMGQYKVDTASKQEFLKSKEYSSKVRLPINDAILCGNEISKQRGKPSITQRMAAESSARNDSVLEEIGGKLVEDIAPLKQVIDSPRKSTNETLHHECTSPNTLTENIRDKLVAGSPLKFQSNSPGHLKKRKLNQESEIPNGSPNKKSQNFSPVITDIFSIEDLEVDFANKQLFEPNFSPRVSRSTSNQIINIETKNKLRVEQPVENDNSMKVASIDCISSDSEVEFANKDNFVPYCSPRKFKIQHEKSSKGKLRCLPERNIKKCDLPARNAQRRYQTKLQTNRSNQNISKRKIGLKVTKRKIVIGKNTIKTTSLIPRKSSLEKINCRKCHKDVHPGNIRIHHKYHCLKEPTKKQWVLHAGYALCLKCHKYKNTESIDFHVKYLCGQKRFLIKCFYCSKISKGYKSVIVHMAKAHEKKHHYQDLMTILPDDALDCAEKSRRARVVKADSNSALDVIVHPTTYHAPRKLNGGIKEESFGRNVIVDDHYVCFYCEFKHLVAYKSLDHMKDVHGKSHNLYDLLDTKLLTSDQENGLESGGFDV